MKKIILALTLVFAAALVVAGCGTTSEFSLVVGDESHAVLTADNAEDGDFAMAGSLTIGEDDILYIEPGLDEGTINIKLIPDSAIDQEADAEDVQASMDPEKAQLDLDVEGTEPIECGLPAGEYTIFATVVKGGSGSIVFRVGEQNEPWTQAATAEEAAKGAGLDRFEVPDGVQTSLGPVAPLSFGYQEGVAEADISAAAVEMRARKGLKASYEDVSFDENEYKYEWSRDIGGTIVKCYGNRDGEATKTVWSDDTYSYALLAYGAGGDDDYGLPAEDLDGLVEAIK